MDANRVKEIDALREREFYQWALDNMLEYRDYVDVKYGPVPRDQYLTENDFREMLAEVSEP